MVIALGIDPGYDRLGLAVVKNTYPKAEVIFSTCLVTKRTDNYSERLLEVGQLLEKTLANNQIDVVALEQIFVAKNLKTAIKVGEVRGLIIYLAQKFNRPIVEFSPATIKLSVAGSGRADKNQVTTMVKHLTNIDSNQRLDDEFDAIAIALTALAHHRLSTKD